MSRIESTFENLKQKNQKALVTFVTAGDPNLATTEKLVLEMAKAGADLIELGIPFSDPMADGPVLQRASERALQKKTTLPLIFSLVEKIRKKSQIPLILMGYYNPILQWGCEKFCKQAAKAGVDGLIVVDLPPEESQELDGFAKKYGLNLIYLLAPTSDDSRIQEIRLHASGFVYYVSMTGVTGGKIADPKSISSHVQKIRKRLKLPVCVGFGIQTPEQARGLSHAGDGVVVGSALVSLLENHGKSGVQKVVSRVAELKKALSQD